MSHNLTPREVRAVKALVEEMGLDRKLVLKTYRSLSKVGEATTSCEVAHAEGKGLLLVVGRGGVCMLPGSLFKNS